MSNRGPTKIQLLEMLDAEREAADEALRALDRIARLSEEALTTEVAAAAFKRVTKLREDRVY